MSDPAREQVGAELRRLRESSGEQAGRAARLAGKSKATLHRIEAGQSPIEPNRAAQLARFYGADTATVDRIAAMAAAAEDADPGGWWDSYGGAPSPWFADYLAVEQNADCIGMWYPTLVPGLLQTREYARATIVSDDPKDVQRQVDIRMHRQKLLEEHSATNVSVWVGEAALRRVVGSREVWRSQMLRLAALASWPEIHIRVVPFDAPAHAGMSAGPVVVLGGRREMAYLEGHGGARSLYDAESVARYRGLLGDVNGASLDDVASRDLLLRLAG